MGGSGKKASWCMQKGAGSAFGFLQLSGWQGGGQYMARLLFSCLLAIQQWYGQKTSQVKTAVDLCRVQCRPSFIGTVQCWFWLTMAVLDNHSWQYAQAGKTLIKLSGRVFTIINVFCHVYLESYLFWFLTVEVLRQGLLNCTTEMSKNMII